ncbi:DUF4339 domain-containing protein [Prosthecobacter sp.]|uniref:DUF4339 domain-containing protein n=1 Tax=Prosthecobacter sp. TaxID=1965333 RepID=UPI0037846BC4
MSDYLITRDGEELGSFDASQIQEGLKSGYFEATDWGWREGMDGWVALPELAGTATAPASTAPAAAPPQTRTIVSPASAPIRKPVAPQPQGVNPYAAPTASVAMPQKPTTGGVPYPVIAELNGTKPWVRFISVLMWLVCIFFIAVVLIILATHTVIAKTMSDMGSSLGWGFLVATAFFYGVTGMLIVYPTLKLSNYASNISRLAESQSFTHLTKALAEQRRFWKFYGIIIAIYMCLVALLILVALLQPSTSIVQPR